MGDQNLVINTLKAFCSAVHGELSNHSVIMCSLD